MANKTYAYATNGEGNLVIGELDIQGSVKIHTKTSVWGLSALMNLNELSKDNDKIKVVFKDRKCNYESRNGYLVIAWGKPKVLDNMANYHDVDDCIVRLVNL